MLSLTIAGGIFLLDYKIKEHIDSTRLQGSKEEVLGGRLLLRNCHNKDKILGKVKIGRENCQELAAAGMGCVAGEYWHQLLHGGNKLSRAGLAMILGGGMSNYTDRRNKGYVTDYVSLNVKKKEILQIMFGYVEETAGNQATDAGDGARQSVNAGSGHASNEIGRAHV